MGTPALSWVLTVMTETLGERSSPPSGSAASARRLWIHETGLCTGVSQYHQANLQKWGSEICENGRLWMQNKNIKRRQQQIIIQVPAVFPLKVSNLLPIPRRQLPLRNTFPGSCQKHTHICLSLRVTQMWSSSADFSSCLVLMAFTAKTSFFL